MDTKKLFLAVQVLAGLAFVAANTQVLEVRNSTECGSYRLSLEGVMELMVPAETEANQTNEAAFRFDTMAVMGCSVHISSMFSDAVKLSLPQQDPDFQDSITITIQQNGPQMFLIKGNTIGISQLIFRVVSASGEVLPGELSLQAKVVRQQSPLLTGFTYLVGVMAIFNLFVLGCRTNLVKMREFIPKNKRAMVIGVFCPMFFLPLMAMCFILGFTFGLEGSVNAFQPMESLMLIILATLPGGGMATPWIILTGGCTVLDYSSMMVITLLSLGSTPLLFFLLGLIWHLDSLPILQYYATRLAVWHTILITAYTLGLILRFFNLKGVWRMVKFFLLPLSICSILALLAFGLYTNVYIFFISRGWVALSALLFPWAAYFFGLLTAFAFRLPWPQIKTVAMNSGVCQPVVAMAVFCWNFPQPEGDVGLFMAFIVLLGSYLPIIISAIIVVSMRCCCGKKDKEDKQKCIPAENGDTHTPAGEDNWGMAAEEGISESEVNLELHSDATTEIVGDKDSIDIEEKGDF